MKQVFKIINSIAILAIIGFLTSCDIAENHLEVINYYHEPIIKIALRERNGGNFIHDVNIEQGESYIHTPVFGSHRVFVITNDNRASNFVPFYATNNMTVTIFLGTDGTLTINQ